MKTARVIRPARWQLALSCDSFARLGGRTSKAFVSVAHPAPQQSLPIVSSHVRPRLRALRARRAPPPNPSLFDTFPT